MSSLIDTIATPKGHWVLDVYDGDVERRPLTPEQVRENRVWESVCAQTGQVYLPLHAGDIVSTPIDRYEGDNLIVTVGKQMIMDRLYGLSGVGAMSRTGVGTSNTAAAVGNTSLTGGVFVAYDSTPTRSSLTVTSVTTFGTGTANITWAELGMDNGTTLLNRIAPIGPFTKTSAVSIAVTVTVTQS